jgi:glycosyltransferase involved in cell wall biosynthesis
MRIGIDGRWYNDSGVGKYTAELIAALDCLERDQELIVFESPANPVPLKNPKKVLKVPVESRKYSVAEQFSLPRLCHRYSLDVFHSPFYLVPWMVSCPVVVTIHDVIPFLFDIYPAWKTRMVKAGYWASAKKASHVVTDSQATAEDAREILSVPRDKISAIPLAVSPRIFNAEANPSEPRYLEEKFNIRCPYIMLIGAGNWKTKNFHRAFEAIEICRQQLEWEFATVFAGNDLWLRLHPQLGSNIPVIATGYVSEADLSILYRHAQVFLFASEYVGFGFPVLEAMSCGCPVICSNAGSLPEVAGDAALGVDPRDSAAMANALFLMMSDASLRSDYRRRSIGRAAQFSWERTASEVFNVYQKVVNGTGFHH